MTTFDERESAFENKFAHDAEMEFKAEAIRNKLVAYWAAELLGKSPMEAAEYAKAIIRADFQLPGHEDVVSKLVADLGSKSDEATIRTKLAEFLEEGRRHVAEGKD